VRTRVIDIDEGPSEEWMWYTFPGICDVSCGRDGGGLTTPVLVLRAISKKQLRNSYDMRQQSLVLLCYHLEDGTNKREK
jgi:hypothetical protein